MTEEKSKAQVEEEEHEPEVSPAEDLMREHGVLNRALLIYEESARRIATAPAELPPDVIADTAALIRAFVEDYHEKLEEHHLFPRFERAGRLVDLVATMRDDAARRELVHLIGQFVRMYRPHETREDTVLFPALAKLVSPHELSALGEDFEKEEHRRFGKGGFESVVDRVAVIEKRLGIHDLAQFTPELPRGGA